ncbi:MAG: DSBA oxidoreductase [Candidatus Peregrinibacteria bacterium GW2011_GWE2_39_6]|nr:MAG: DSBA oxidoreductase [Candidatus Peregrinibacteria bacterium GW2011_GWF2_39_17]KKR25818.1 MAG: DSBA oxidoreductase [Candidatus Peregrinibacteria bacterium GW2011_GWE2_39_6]HCW32277.1 disulfide bond formation protein DsbA [Candidatus Peregrinibacteria bacterium]
MFQKKLGENLGILAVFFLVGGVLGYLIGGGLPVVPGMEQPDNVVEGDLNQPVEVITASVDDDAILGDENAPITVIEFSDYQCPFCKRFVDESFPQIEENYIKTGKVKLIFRDYPLPFHANAKIAAVAVECAGNQDAYYVMHDALFAGSEEWSSLPDPSEIFQTYAMNIGLDAAQFSQCLSTQATASEVEQDLADAMSYGVDGTPTFFINGQKLVGAQPYSVFENIFNSLLAQ